jgi:hypothetical protein
LVALARNVAGGTVRRQLLGLLFVGVGTAVMAVPTLFEARAPPRNC